MHRILGPDRAEVIDENGSRSPSPPFSPVEPAAFVWEHEATQELEGGSTEESRRPSRSSGTTTIVCSDDLHSCDLPYNKNNWHQGIYEENGLLSAPNSPTALHKEFSLPGGFEENGLLSAPNSPVVPHKNFFGSLVSTQESCNDTEGLEESIIHHLPKSQSCSDIEDRVTINLSIKIHEIPEVRIHTCE